MSLPTTLEEIVHDVVLTKYFSAIGFTIVVYDTLLTLSDELRLVWPDRLSLVKALFYIGRFVSFFFIALNTYHLAGIAPEFSETFCQVLILTTGYGAIFAFAITNWLLLSRAIALWGGTRRIVWVMTIFYFITYMATISVATVASVSLIDHIFYSPLIGICAVSLRPNTFGAVWVPSIIFEMVLFGILFTKVFQHARHTAGSTSKLIQTLHRDGIVYFVVIFALRLFNLIAWAALPISLIFIGIFLLWSCTTVLLTRMHLNLKAIGAQINSSDEELEELGGAAIEFKHSVVRSNIVADEAYRRPPVRLFDKKRRRDQESGIETNIFAGGTRIDPQEFEEYRQEAIATTRPNTTT